MGIKLALQTASAGRVRVRRAPTTDPTKEVDPSYESSHQGECIEPSNARKSALLEKCAMLAKRLAGTASGGRIASLAGSTYPTENSSGGYHGRDGPICRTASWGRIGSKSNFYRSMAIYGSPKLATRLLVIDSGEYRRRIRLWRAHSGCAIEHHPAEGGEQRLPFGAPLGKATNTRRGGR